MQWPRRGSRPFPCNAEKWCSRRNRTNIGSAAQCNFEKKRDEPMGSCHRTFLIGRLKNFVREEEEGG